MARLPPIRKPNPLAADDVHERISDGTKAAAQISHELLIAERGGGLQNPVIGPAVVFVEQLNVIFSHGWQRVGDPFVWEKVRLGNLTLHCIFGETREVDIPSQSGIVGGKANRVCRVGNRYQSSDVRAIRVGQENVRPFGKRELPTVGGPHSPMSDNIRKMSGASRRQRQYIQACSSFSMTAPFVRVLVFCKLKLTRRSLGAVVVMKSGANEPASP
jgi:hypothetical protein